MFTLITIGVGLTVGTIRCIIYQKSKGKREKKLRYYNYSRYAIKYKKISDALEQQSKNIF